MIEDPKQSFQALVLESKESKGLGRLFTLKAMVELGPGWHPTGRIMTWLEPYTHTNYIFELASRWPKLVEVNLRDKEVRLAPAAYKTIKPLIDKAIGEVKQAKF